MRQPGGREGVVQGMARGDGIPELMTPREVGKKLRVAPETIRRMVRRGELRGYRISETVLRVDAESVRELVRPQPK